MLRPQSMRRRLLRLVSALTLVCVLTGCFPRNEPLCPRLEYTPQKADFRKLAAPFTAVEPHERATDWGREYRLGVGFARDFDLYRAITSFKRALILLPRREKVRRLEIYYYISLCYFLGDRFCEVIETVEQSPLMHVTPDFPAYQEVLVMLHTAYVKTGDCEKADKVQEALDNTDPELAEKISLSTALTGGCIATLSHSSNPDIQQLVTTYCRCRKSVQKAQSMSAVIPGSGFWYVGQKQSAITAFVLNALFIAASWQLFARGYWALGIFTTSLEIGWYVGGIYGAGEAAHHYNTCLYERLAASPLHTQRLYPSLMIRWSF